MATLKELAHEGRTVLTSIHQPSSPVFQAFDKIFLIADGQVRSAARVAAAVAG